MHGHGLPTVVPDAAMAEHLVVLGGLVRRDIGVGERVSKTDSLDRLLGDTLVHVGCFNSDTFENRGQHVGDMVVLVAGGTGIADAVRPMHDERIPDTALIGVLLIEPKWRVADLRPAGWVVVVEVWPADFVDSIDHVFGTASDQVEEPKFVERAVFAAFLAGAIVGDEHDDGVIEHIDLFKEVDEPTDLVVGVIQESSEGFLHPGVEPTVGLR